MIKKMLFTIFKLWSSQNDERLCHSGERRDSRIFSLLRVKPMLLVHGIVALSFVPILLLFTSTKAEAAIIMCQKPLDVAIVVDNSCSIANPTAEDEYYDLMNFVEAFPVSFTVSPQQTKVSIIKYDGYIKNPPTPSVYDIPYREFNDIDDAVVEVPLSGNKNTILNRTGEGINGLRKYNLVTVGGRTYKVYPNRLKARTSPYPATTCGSTNTRGGLKAGVTELAKYSNLRASGELAERVIIILTDGVFNDAWTNGVYPGEKSSQDVATDAKANGYRIFTVLVGYNSLSAGEKALADAKLPPLASDPTSSHFFKVDDFASFQQVVEAIINYACGVDELNVSGFVLSNDQIETERKINVNSFYKYLDNTFFLSILKVLGEAKHFVFFD